MLTPLTPRIERRTYLTDEPSSNELVVAIYICQLMPRGLHLLCLSLPSSFDADLPPVGIHRLDRVDRNRTDWNLAQRSPRLATRLDALCERCLYSNILPCHKLVMFDSCASMNDREGEVVDAGGGAAAPERLQAPPSSIKVGSSLELRQKVAITIKSGKRSIFPTSSPSCKRRGTQPLTKSPKSPLCRSNSTRRRARALSPPRMGRPRQCSAKRHWPRSPRSSTRA